MIWFVSLFIFFPLLVSESVCKSRQKGLSHSHPFVKVHNLCVTSESICFFLKGTVLVVVGLKLRPSSCIITCPHCSQIIVSPVRYFSFFLVFFFCLFLMSKISFLITKIYVYYRYVHGDLECGKALVSFACNHNNPSSMICSFWFWTSERGISQCDCDIIPWWVWECLVVF